MSIALNIRRAMTALGVSLLLLGSGSAYEGGPEDLQVSKRLLEDGFATEARSLLRAYVEANTEDFYALHMLGLAEYQREDYKEALRWFLISDSKDHRGEIRTVNHSYMARCYELLGDLQNALEFYRRYTEVNPKEFPIWHTKGSIALDLGQYELAYEYLLPIPQAYEHYNVVLVDRVKALYHLENYSEVLSTGDRVNTQSLDQDTLVSFYYYLINAAIITEDFYYAFGIVEELERATDSPNREVMSQYIMLALNTDHQDKGLRKGLEYCEFFPADKTTYPLLSQYLESRFQRIDLKYFQQYAPYSDEFYRLYLRKLYATGNYQTYVKDYAKLQHSDAYLHLLQVRSLKQIGQANVALQEIAMALELYLEPQDQYPFHAMEYTIRHKQGMPVLAISQLIFENYPSSEAYYNYISDLYMANEYDEIIRVLETYGYEGDDHALIFSVAGNSAMELQEYERAIAYYLQVSSTNSAMELNTVHRIAFAYDMLEDTPNALEYYRQAQKLVGDNERIRRNIQQRIVVLEQLQP